MYNVLNKFFNIFGDGSTSNFQLIKWAKWLNIKPFYYAMTDEIQQLPEKSKSFYAIINYQNSNQPGTHHVALISRNGQRYYFDSYGFEAQKEIIENYSPLRASNYQVQKYGTNNCGQLSLLVIYLMKNGFTFEEIVLLLKNEKEK